MRGQTSSQSVMCHRRWFFNGTFHHEDIVVGVGGLENTFTRSDVLRRVADASGWRAPTPYSALYRSGLIWPEGSFTYNNSVSRKDWITFRGVLCNVGAPTIDTTIPFPSQNDVNRAETEALLKVKNSVANYAVVLAEISKAAEQVGGIINAVANAYNLIKNGKRRAAARVLGIPVRWKDRKLKPNQEQLARDWLGLQYGLIPMYNDAYGIIEDLRARIKGRKPRFSVTRNVRTPFFEVVPKGQALVLTQFVKGFRVAKVRFDFEMDDTFVRQIVEQGLTNPLEVAWELVPFSFVIDWFAPVGNLVSALDATVGARFKAGTLTKYGEVTRNGYLSSGAPTQYYAVEGRCSWEGRRLERSVYTQFPWPMPYVKSPVSGMHLANALALLINLR